ncbi:MAG: serine/threonine protein kinase, partial [Kofleriaceae bacterium]
MATAPGGTMGRFVVLGVLGAGGMGVVLQAFDPELDRKVAIKVLRSGGAGVEARARLQREAQAMAKLSHPNAVTVYEVGRAGDHLFIAMELVEGTTLKAWLAAAPRTWREVLAMYVATGRGLEAAHRAGLVHRDFKPENVLLGADGRPRVSDFGLAESGARDPEVVAGTPIYMAPEQWLGGDSTADRSRRGARSCSASGPQD